jgi:two-component system nitrate/nitrite response regulator NarL
MSVSKKKIKILIVDDHPVVRKGLLSCLAAKEHLKIVGEAANGNEALKLVKELAPDIVLMDISMPEMDGLAVTETLRKDAPNAKVLILSMQSNRDSVLRIIKAGARGYVLKDAPTDELVSAIENQYVTDADESRPVAKLSDREREVLSLIAEGKSNKEIAMHLGIGVRTTETHRERIMRKLDIHSVAGLTKFAIANGISSLEAGEKP